MRNYMLGVATVLAVQAVAAQTKKLNQLEAEIETYKRTVEQLSQHMDVPPDLTKNVEAPKPKRRWSL